MMHLFAQVAPSSGVSMWPFAILAICLAAIVIMITKLRVHAFIALIFAAILAGLLAEKLPQDPKKPMSHWVRAVELSTEELGKTAGGITVVIAMAAIIGVCLMESGAADKVVRRFLALFGQRRAGGAIAASSYVMSIPIFFDTFFMLLLPLAKAMSIRVGRDYLLFTMAICCGAVVTHSLIAPHPGPLAMAEALKIDLGLTIVVGLVVGVFPTLASWFTVKWINRRMSFPMRETPGASLEELKKMVNKDESELPSTFWSIMPVIVPIFLISLASTFNAVDSFKNGNQGLFSLVQFLGNRNVALIIGTALAVTLLMRQQRIGLATVFQRIAPALETAGMIILITSAGGAFGLMLRNAGVGDTIQALMKDSTVNLLVVSWLVAAVIRVAQGSATVAMLTTAAMIAPLMHSAVEAGTLPYHPVYVFCAIGFGGMTFSWMNDSGFWVVGRLSGFTEKETLKSWTVVTTVNSIVGLIVTLIASMIVPLTGK
jgi:GntP family gluconate:H+ symporter